MFKFKDIKYLSFFISITFLIGCKNQKDTTEDLFYADVNYDLNSFLRKYSFNNINSYYLEDSLRGKDSINDVKFHFASLLYFKKKTIDSLYEMVPNILWNNTDYIHLDTMTYVNSINIIDANSIVSEDLRHRTLSLIKELPNIQKQLIEIKARIEKIRTGEKKEKIDCQNCKLMCSEDIVSQVNNIAGLYLELEKQFLIIYRELSCATFAIELIDVRKVASKNYKVRI